jgi:AcrR family transcriptional regulator
MRTRSVTSPVQRDKIWQSLKRQTIRDAVIQIMCRDGLAAVTMDRVAQEAGIAKGTVYLHFKDKQHLLDAVKDDSLEPIVVKLTELAAGDLSPTRKVQAFALRYLTYFDERRNLFRVLLYEREVTRVQGSRYRADRYMRLVALAAKIVGEGIACGAFRSVPLHKTAAMFVESNIAIVNHRLIEAERSSPVEEDAEMIADLFLRALRPDPVSGGRE